MSRDYAMSRVKDALEKSGGNQLKAQRLVLSWLEKDHTLLFGLVEPHMQGIITHAVAHAALPVRKIEPLKKVNVQPHETGEFGNAVLQSLRGRSDEMGSFGEASPRGLSKPGKASKAHVDAINTLVKASKAKDKKTKK